MNVEDEYAYGVEVPSVKHELSSQDEEVCMLTCVDGCKHVLCKHTLD